MNKITLNKSKIIFMAVAVFLFMLFILLMPEKSSNAVRFGLTVCGEIIIPSLFPFAFLCILIYSTNISKILDRILNLPMRLLGFNGNIGSVIIMSLIGGYPVGSKLIAMLYNDKIINSKTANILLMFCVSPGPAFVIVAVGNGMLRNSTAGFLIFASCIISSIVSMIVISMILRPKCALITRARMPFSEGIIKSISDASASTIQICSFVVIFSCIGAAVKEFLPSNISTILTSVLEVTNGCLFSSKISLYLVAFIISFAGIAVHFQIFSFCGKLKIDYTLFYIGRIIHSVFTVSILFLLEKIFPVTTHVGSFGDIKKTLEISATSVCSLCLICMSFVIMCYWILSLKEIEEKKSAR